MPSKKSSSRTLLVTRSVFSGQRKARWFFREKPIDEHDTGWRVVGDGDTQGYINHQDNVLVIDVDTFKIVEPNIEQILELPISSELERIEENGEVIFQDCKE